MAHAAAAAAMRRRKSTANFMDQRQTQKSIQHAVKRVMELSSLKRTTRNLAEVIEQAMAECNSRASRDSNFAHLTSEQLQRAHEMHLKLCEKAGLKETPRSRRRSRAAPETTVSVSVASTSFLLIFGRLVSARRVLDGAHEEIASHTFTLTSSFPAQVARAPAAAHDAQELAAAVRARPGEQARGRGALRRRGDARHARRRVPPPRQPAGGPGVRARHARRARRRAGRAPSTSAREKRPGHATLRPRVESSDERARPARKSIDVDATERETSEVRPRRGSSARTSARDPFARGVRRPGATPGGPRPCASSRGTACATSGPSRSPGS